MFDYYLKKLIGTLAMPMPIILFLLVLGTALFLFSNYHTCAKILLLTVIILLLITTTSLLPNFFLRRLQSQYPILEKVPPHVKYIVVLGGGYHNRSHIPATSNLGSSSLARLIEALRLYHTTPDATLIVSGAGYYHYKTSVAQTYKEAAITMGIPANKIIVEPYPHDTRQEAQRIAKIVKQQPFVLVTSAFHMPRSVSLFKRQGTHPIAAPCDYQGTKINKYNPANFVPSTNYLYKSTTVWHEYLGMLWYRLLGN